MSVTELHRPPFSRAVGIVFETVWRNAEMLGHAGAVLGDLGGRILGADAAVEAFVDAIRHPARTREEAVADAGKLGQ